MLLTNKHNTHKLTLFFFTLFILLLIILLFFTNQILFNSIFNIFFKNYFKSVPCEITTLITNNAPSFLKAFRTYITTSFNSNFLFNTQIILNPDLFDESIRNILNSKSEIGLDYVAQFVNYNQINIYALNIKLFYKIIEFATYNICLLFAFKCLFIIFENKSLKYKFFKNICLFLSICTIFTTLYNANYVILDIMSLNTLPVTYQAKKGNIYEYNILVLGIDNTPLENVTLQIESANNIIKKTSNKDGTFSFKSNYSSFKITVLENKKTNTSFKENSLDEVFEYSYELPGSYHIVLNLPLIAHQVYEE